MNKYRVIVVLEIDECSVEAASSSNAEELVIADLQTRFHADAKIKIVSSSAESE
jgi:hypothetical protein